MSARRRKYGLIGVGVLLPAIAAAGIAIGATSSSQPANKVVAAGDTDVVAGAGQEVTLLTATMKTSKPTDLMIQTAAECTIWTDLVTNNTTKSATASGRMLVWIEFDHKVVPVQQISTPPQDGSTPEEGDKEKDGAVFCDREYSRTVSNDETSNDGVDQESDYIHTKSAHAFNWVKMNAGSGVHTIEMRARLTKTATSTASSKVEVRNRTMIVEPTKMANDAIIGTTGTN